MASMMLGWTLNDVTTAMGLGTTGHLLNASSKSHQEGLAALVKGVKERLPAEGDVDVWLMCQQDSCYDYREPVVVGAPMVFGGKVPEVLWYLAPNENVQGFPSTTTVADLQAIMNEVSLNGPGELPSPTVHLSGWHAEAERLAPLLGVSQIQASSERP